VAGADTYTAMLEPASPGGARQRAEGITATSASFMGLAPSTGYYLSVFAVDGGHRQLPAGKRCSTLAAPAGPRTPACSAVTANTVTLSWSSSAGVGWWYVARQVPGPRYVDGGRLASATLSKQFTGLSPNTAYEFALWWQTSRTSPWMRVLPNAQCTTAGSAAGLAAPACGAATSDSVTLNWAANPWVHQWHIARATVPATATATTAKAHTDGRTLGSATLSRQFAGLSPNTSYQFYFWWRDSPAGSWTRVKPDAVCATAALASYPAPVCGTTTPNSAELRWGANASVESWHTARTGTAGVLIDSRLFEGRTLSAAFTGLAASTSYEFPLWWQTSPAADWQQARPDRSCTTRAAAATPVSTRCASTSKYCVTRGVHDAVLRVARKAITPPAGAQCTQTQITKSGRSQITQNMLASMMLAIPESELLSDDVNASYTNRALSPMTLSRGDNMNHLNRDSDSHNLMLYSHMTLSGYKRAHWNAGVGLWQIDNFDEPAAQVDALKYGHAERADIDKGGYEVAKYIRYKYCKGEYALDRWVACDNGSCRIRHNNRYSTTSDNFQVEIIEGLADPTGGVQERLCRWGAAGKEMVCYLYDLGLKEGYVKIGCCESGGGGTNPYTPEAAPFISFTDTTTNTGKKTKFAVWPKAWPPSSAGLAWPATIAAGRGETAKTIIRAARSTEEARFSPYNDDSNPNKKGIAHHGLTKGASESIAKYEADIETEIARLNGGPLTVNNSADGYGLSTDGPGPEGWFDGAVNGLDLQVYNCPGTIGDTLVEACWASTNGAPGSSTD